MSFALLLLIQVPHAAAPPGSIGGPSPIPAHTVAVGAAAPSPLVLASASLRSGHGPIPGLGWTCPGPSPATVRCSSAPLGARPLGTSSGGWVPAALALHSVGSGVAFLVDDVRDGYALLMTQTPSNNATAYFGTPAQYYTFQNGTWGTLAVPGGPSYCGAASLAYDSTDQEVVYWGGGSCATARTTWTFQAGSWTNVTSSTAPPALEGSAVSDDPGVAGLLWFGGCACTHSTSGSNATWKFSAGTWSNLTGTLSVAPVPEWNGVMSYDSADAGVLLLEGSTSGSSGFTYGAWFFNGTWTHEASPPANLTAGTARVPSIADDPSDGYVLVVPAWNGTRTTGVAWTYLAGAWAAAPAHPGLLEGPTPVAAFEGASSAVVLLDGSGQAGALVETWGYSGGAWTNLTPTSAGLGGRADVAMTYDAADGYVLLFGGCACPQNGAVAGVQSDTWKFANSTWSRVAVNASPPARSMAGLAYDASDGYVVLFGGQGSSGTFNDTWEYTNGGWSLLTPLLAPPWTPGAEMTYDGADNYVVVLTGSFPPST
ncbi:MAG TPA: hypothetical protein VJQ43_05595, partial [Thermoplasmata archaeon]|nr:hypothetical protein [Thermoplasmata archaeon]